MKAYKARFKKKNGDERDMFFVKLPDLPDRFLGDKVSGEGIDKMYPERMELVWDLEASNFRVFNWATKIGKSKRVTISEEVL